MTRIFFLIFLVSLTTVAQDKSLKKKDIPSGFQVVKKRGLMVSTSEITALQWVDFMNSTGDTDGKVPLPNNINDKCVCTTVNGEIEMREPISIVFRDTTYIKADKKNKGKKHRSTESCYSMPITGITVEQAQAYCAWVTEYYNLKGFDFNFRLATPQEYDSLLSDVLNQWKPTDDNYKAYTAGINTHGCAIYNFSHNSWCENNLQMKYNFGYAVPMQTSLFFADGNGLYDLMGNVAELTSEKGVAKGGSCKDLASACQPGAINNYEGPQWWLGFRVVAELE